MSDPRTPENEAPKPALEEAMKTIVAETKGKGMSTVTIMRALFEANVGLRNVGTGVNDILNQAIILDGQAAGLHENLGVIYKQNVDALTKLVNLTQDNIARLSSVKTAAQLAQNYDVQCSPLVNAVHELDKSRTDMYKSAEEFITSLRSAYKTLGEMMEKSSRDPAAKEKIAKLAAELTKKRLEAKNLFDGKHVDTVRKNITTLYTEVERTTAANVVPGSAATKPGQPRTLE